MKMKAILKVLESEMNKLRKEYAGDTLYATLGDPFNDTKIYPKTRMDLELIEKRDAEGNLEYRFTDHKLVKDPNVITVTFDGEGYDYLSYESEYHGFRNRLEERLEKLGVYIEDVFTWAFHIIEM